MTSSKPYLIRAIYDWLVDNELTPYIVVDVTGKDQQMQVPEEHIDNGRIILNISPKACRGLHLENDRIIFSARFSGEVKQLFVPPHTVQAIYAKENGRGMVFSEDDENELTEPTLPVSTSSPSGTKRSSGRPSLTVVK
jgi:stringent starvation protein B